MALDTATFKLSQAIAFRRANEIKELLNEEGLVNKLNENGDYPLIQAAGQGHKEVVKMLLDAGAEINIVKPDSRHTPLIQAAWAEHAEIVKLLIAAGADVHAKDKSGYPALFHGMGDRKKTNLQIVQALIAAGADVNAAGLVMTVLMRASRVGSPEMVKALIAAGANVNATARFGTALIMAANSDRADNAAVLIGGGADPCFRLPHDFENAELSGKTALDVAREKKAKKTIHLFESAQSS